MTDILAFIRGEAKPQQAASIQEVREEEEMCLLYRDPDPSEACAIINRARSRYVIVIYGNLCAHYEGRARAELELAPRLLILKPDGALLVHESTKREPVIWQPPKAVYYASVENGVLIIKSVRQNPPETVRIEIPAVYFLGLFKVAYTPNYRVYGTERDLVKFLVENINLVEPNLKVLATEYSTPVGDIDILAEDSEGNLVVIEVKRGQAGPEAVHQLKRYVEYMQARHENRKVRGILVAQDISGTAYRYLREYGFKFVRVPQRVLEKIQHTISDVSA